MSVQKEKCFQHAASWKLNDEPKAEVPKTAVIQIATTEVSQSLFLNYITA